MKAIVIVLFGSVAGVTVYTILLASPGMPTWAAVTAGVITSFFVGLVT